MEVTNVVRTDLSEVDAKDGKSAVKGEAKSSKAESWIDAPGSAGRIDDIRVRVTRAVYDYVRVEDILPGNPRRSSY